MKKITFTRSLLEGYYDGDTREQINQKYAAMRAFVPAGSALSKQMAEFEQVDKNTALLRHASDGDIDEVMLDLENGADPTYKQSIAYKMAFTDGHYDVARLLRQRGASDPTVDQRLDNLSESITGKFGFIKHLLESHSEDDSYWSDEQEDRWREDDKYQNWEDAHAGAVDGPADQESEEDYQDYLLRKVDPMLKAGSKEGVLKLINDEFLDVNYNHNRLIYNAAEYNQLGIVKVLLDAGAEATGGALQKAIVNNNPSLVKLLLDAGAPPLDGLLQTSVARYRDGEITQLLLDAGGDPELAKEEIERYDVVKKAKAKREEARRREEEAEARAWEREERRNSKWIAQRAKKKS